MATTTPNLGLTKPDPGGDDDAWAPMLNGNADILDVQVKAAQDVASAALAAANGKVGLTGNETIAGVKNFSSEPQINNLTIGRLRNIARQSVTPTTRASFDWSALGTFRKVFFNISGIGVVIGGTSLFARVLVNGVEQSAGTDYYTATEFWNGSNATFTGDILAQLNSMRLTGAMSAGTNLSIVDGMIDMGSGGLAARMKTDFYFPHFSGGHYRGRGIGLVGTAVGANGIALLSDNSNWSGEVLIEGVE